MHEQQRIASHGNFQDATPFCLSALRELHRIAGVQKAAKE
jgi:hypothetical protein